MEGAVTVPSPDLWAPARRLPERGGGVGVRGTKRKGMLAGGRGGDWEEVKGVGGRRGAGEPDYWKPRPEGWPLGGSVERKSRLLRASDLGLPFASWSPCFCRHNAVVKN